MIDVSSLSDEQLVLEVREKDKELYGEIIRRYQSKLSHYLRKFIRDPDELEDVLQAVFIKCFQNIYGFDEKKKFSSWIYRIAHNEAINHIRKNAKSPLSIDDMEYQIVDKKIDSAGRVDQGMLKKAVEEVLTEMKPKYREPIILYFFEERTYEEISDILRIPVSTVGTLLLRGKKILKEKLTAYGKKV